MNMRRFTHRKKKRELSTKRNLSRVLIACFVLILALSVLLIFKSGIFNIKTIEVNVINNLGCASLDQLKDASQLLGQNIFWVSNVTTSKNIKNKFVCVKEVGLSKQFPDIVKLDVLGREPKAKLLNLPHMATASANLENIATPSAEQPLDIFLVDEEVIFAKDTNRFLVPKIFLRDFNLSEGRKADYLIKEVLNILEKLKSFGLNIQTTQIINQFLVIFPENLQPKIIFRLGKDINAQIASLQLILKIAKIDSSSVEFIDLRFDKPVVRFAPKKN